MSCGLVVCMVLFMPLLFYLLGTLSLLLTAIHVGLQDYEVVHNDKRYVLLRPHIFVPPPSHPYNIILKYLDLLAFIFGLTCN